MESLPIMLLSHALDLPEPEAESVWNDARALEEVLGAQPPEKLRALLEAFAQFIDFQSREAKQHIRALEASRAEAEELRDKAERASRTKDRLMANISHEIRTPMHGVLGMIDLLRDTILDETQIDYVDTIKRSGDAMMKVLNDIHDFSRPTGEKEELNLKSTNVEKLLGDVVRAHAGKAAEKGLEIALHVEPAVPRHIETDESRLNHVLTNLVDNAVKFTNRGGVRIWVGMEPQTTGRLLFCVEDDGIGIPASELSRVFDPVRPNDEPASGAQFAGARLGLAASRKLVESLGGSLGVESDEGVGSNFWFTIAPVAGSAADLAENDGEERAGSPFAIFDESPPEPVKRVLVVEDNPVNQTVALLTIKRLGHQVDLAEDGAEAVEAALSNAYDVIFMDLELPVMGGIEATRKIRDYPNLLNPEVRILATTGHVFDEMRDRCEKSGMDGFLPKPFQLAELKAALDG